MNFDVANILKIIGPAASIIFAAWIFVGFLQTRYDSAVDRYRDLIDRYRRSELQEVRKANIRDEVVCYKRRCELMAQANLLGLLSAVLLILALILGGLALALPEVAPLKYACLGSGLIGFLLVIVATVLVIMEGRITRRQISSELLDIPDLAQSAGQEAGDIRDPQRHQKFM